MATTSTPLEGMDEGDLFTYFVEKAATLEEIQESFAGLKARLDIQEEYGFGVFTTLQAKLTHWKAKGLWDMLAGKARRKEYAGQTACAGRRVLIVGAGPIGMRLAIELSLLGCEAVVVEKRPYFSRNNVLHLWPCTIDDLRRLGAKKFYGGFCAGAIDHISIKRLQAMLMKVALIVGVRFIVGVEFLKISEPSATLGWHASFNPSSHEINNIDFHVLVGAEGKRQQIPGFDRKELRAKLALAITANFKNHRTQQEAAVEEISGVAFIFNQAFFKQLKNDTGIDLENIVYYKDDTHYFIMTAKKESLLLKGVLKKDYSDPYQLLAPSNRDTLAMYNYAREAADWSTELPQLDFALNHKGIPDVDLFDFTSIYQAEYSCRAVRRSGKDLFICLVGDTLLQPFWPQGTGLGRGFLSAMDTAWLVRQIGPRSQELSPTQVLEILAERESIYQRLPQTTPSNIMKQFGNYTINPHTRYPNLRMNAAPETIVKLYNTDESISIQSATASLKRFAPTTPSHTPHKRPREQQPAKPSPPKPVNKEGQVTRALYGEPEEHAQLLDHKVLLGWLKEQLQPLGITVKDLNRSWSDGLALCGLIYRYHPELIPQYPNLTRRTAMENCQLAFSVAENHFGFQKILKPSEMLSPDTLALFTYLSLFYEFFQNKEPVSVAPAPTATAAAAATVSPTKGKSPRKSKESSKYQRLLMASPPSAVERSWNTRTVRKTNNVSPQRSLSFRKKRQQRQEREKLEEEPTTPTRSVTRPKSTSVLVSSTPEPSTASTTSSTPVQPSVPATRSHSKSTTALQTTPTTRDTPPARIARRKAPAPPRARPVSTFGTPTSSSDICFFCNKRVYLLERMSANGVFFHRACFRCNQCNCQLNLGSFNFCKGQSSGDPGKFFCPAHYRQLFLSDPTAINYGRSRPEDWGKEKTPVGVAKDVTPPIPEEEEEEDEETVQEKKIKRSLTKRLSSYFKRRSRRSKSPSPEKRVSVKRASAAAAEPMMEEEVEETEKEVEKEDSLPAIVESPLPAMRNRSRIIKRPGASPPMRVVSSLSPDSSMRRSGQRTVVRKMQSGEDEIQERQKQQQRLLEAQSIQREMSQIELQYEELEEVSRDVEQNLRDSEGTSQEDMFMKAWLGLIAERNALVRHQTELSLQMKTLELEDKQLELEKEMREMEYDDPLFQPLLDQLVETVHERDNIVQQVDQERIRELEEDESHNAMLYDAFGIEADTSPDTSPTIARGRDQSKKKTFTASSH